MKAAHKVSGVVLGLALLLSVGCEEVPTEPVDASAVPPEFAFSGAISITDLGTIGGIQSAGRSINDRGHAAT